MRPAPGETEMTSFTATEKNNRSSYQKAGITMSQLLNGTSRISRRTLLASLGATGAAIAASGLVYTMEGHASEDFPLCVMHVPDLEALAELDTSELQDKQLVQIGAFWKDTNFGGKLVQWFVNEPVASHDGGIRIDPARLTELDHDNQTFGSYFAPDTVSGNTGCFVALGGHEVGVDQFGAIAGDPSFDNRIVIQKTIDAVRTAFGGGEVTLRPLTYWISGHIHVWERVKLVGFSGMAVNFYSNTDFSEKGSTLKLIPGSNDDLVRLVISGNTAGSPIPTETNVDRRHGGGISGICLNGNRSESQHPSEVDLNQSGNGLSLIGVNLVDIENVIVVRCAGNGVRFAGNGQPDGQCNNIRVDRVYAGLNKGTNFELSGGDSVINEIWAFYSAGNGVTSSMANTQFSNFVCNDNLSNGFFATGPGCTYTGQCYDNRSNGFQTNGNESTLLGVVARHNGMNTGLPNTSRCGIVIGSTAEHFSVHSCQAYDIGYRGDPMNISQQYGFRVLNDSTNGVFDSNGAFGNAVSDYSIANTTKIEFHPGGSSASSHPGFKAKGSINLDGNQLQNIRGLTGASPLTVSSISSNVLNVTSNLRITLNVSGGATVNSISDTFTGLGEIYVRNINADPITFNHGSGINTKTGLPLTLNQNQGVVHLIEMADGNWYEV